MGQVDSQNHLALGGSPLGPRIEAFLRTRGFRDARVTRLAPLVNPEAGEHKAFGYGKPIRVSFESSGETREVVLRTAASNPFGHDRRADRLDALVLAYDTFGQIPRQVRALDVGVFAADGALCPLPAGEPFLLTDYVEGTLYARDLEALGPAPRASSRDLDRAHALARYLAELHAETRPASTYIRAIRDTVGHGEGIFGLIDSYPDQHPVASRARLEAIEVLAVRWRTRLRPRSARARRTHGDFHPFNLLFREGSDFSVLDTSRGGAGDPADDVACLSINYLFFALAAGRARFEGPLRELWDAFFATYLDATRDLEILEVVPLFYAWRALVVASPLWYPRISNETRDRLLGFAERLLEGAPFHPSTVDEVLA